VRAPTTASRTGAGAWLTLTFTVTGTLTSTSTPTRRAGSAARSTIELTMLEATARTFVAAMVVAVEAGRRQFDRSLDWRAWMSSMRSALAAR
jgi:hypothetical protein